MVRGSVTLRAEFLKGIISENPTFVQVLGTCPTLAVTTSAANGMAMALATSFALVCSSAAVSLLRRFIPHQVRIAAYMVIIAAFVTIADLVLAASYPDISRALGPYVPLIVVNCIILGRAEAFASKNGVVRSVVDALGNGAGFLIVLVALGSVRELLGAGAIFGTPVTGGLVRPWLVMILPAGAFLTLGLANGLIRWVAAGRDA